ncbi:MAG: gliding motility-associated C-terminal domain-containing protein [Flavobacteriales bacterium]|nr:gliding motility-associated C-terminal domain-containing protein [Flavobacteriales bacterium]
MRFLCSLAFLLSAAGQSLFAQEYWVQKFGGLGGDAVHDVIVGADDHIYVAGEFAAGMEVDGTPLNSFGASDGFVAKLDPTGELEWMKQVGGTAIDRCWKLAMGADGTLAVAGQYMGPADLFGTSAPGTNNTWNAFLAKLDPNTGNATWVRTGGANDGTDRPNGISISPNGNITMVGEFSGTAVFDAGTITSMYDPILQQPGVDVFIASYAGNGDALWLKHGTAEFTDKAVDVVSDADNNLYVCGQFSDTITFDLVHENAMYNAIFILKLDFGGNEVWFRRCGGAIVDVVNDMLLTSNGDLLLCGDLRGNMFYLDGTTDVVQADDEYAYFLLRLNTAGDHIAHSVLGSNNPVSAKAIDQLADTVVVFGEFQCQFTDLSEYYDSDGLFMATGPQDLFIAQHLLVGMQFSEAQQFGGQKNKHAGGIALLSSGDPLFAGGFEQLLVLPGDRAVWGDWNSHYGFCGTQYGLFCNNSTLSTFCSDSAYGAYNGIIAAGSWDGFLSNGRVRNRQPYDFWNRNNAFECERHSLEFCIRSGANTLATAICGDTIINCYCQAISMLYPAGSEFPVLSYAENIPCSPDSVGYIGPDVNFFWSNGSTEDYLIPPSTGWYWCTITSANGCWAWTDSAYVINDCIWPLISDDVVVNTNAGMPGPINTCTPFWAFTPNVPPDYICTWYQAGQTDTLVTDSLYITHSGSYGVMFLSPHGCRTINQVWVTVYEEVDLPNVSALVSTLFNADGSVFNSDTLHTCPIPCIGGYLELDWYVNGLLDSLDEGLFLATTLCGESGTLGNPNEPMAWGVPGYTSGWSNWTIDLVLHNGPCGSDTMQFHLQDSVYVHVVPLPTFVIDPPTHICAGDSLLLLATCQGCDSMRWWSEDAIYSTNFFGDSAWCDAGGYFGFSLYYTELGVTCSAGTFFQITEPVGPDLQLIPNVICLGDSALLFTNMIGNDQQWIGPSGPVGQNLNSLYVHEFGDYYLTLTDANGCVLSNGPISLYGFGSPFLQVDPDQIICPGETVAIEVQTNNPGSIVWNAPLSGSDTLQLLDQPGTYSCTVTTCGQAQTLSVNVIGGQPNAEVLDPGPFALCAGNSVLLEAVPGQVLYIWVPMDSIATSIVVDTSGWYQLITSDVLGCFDTSAVIVVSITDPLIVDLAQDTAICPGTPIVLSGIGPYDDWYWSTDEAATSITVEQPGNYTVLAYDTAGCMITSSIIVAAIPCDPVLPDDVIGNVITPNGDGINDSWGFGATSSVERATIFTRWGNVVFDGDPRIAPWSGRGANGEPLADGVYFFVLRLHASDNTDATRTGYIQLVH